MSQYIVLLSDISYELGLIGLAEYEERLAAADWLAEPGEGYPDPRATTGEHDEVREQSERTNSDSVVGNSPSGPGGHDGDGDDDGLVRLVVLGTWMFTVGDRDCYPSVPHGHDRGKTRSWPKLNPYTGRVFSGMHQEDVRARLTRNQMRVLWSDPVFVDHCREQVLWYRDFAPRYTFPGARRGWLAFPKWR